MGDSVLRRRVGAAVGTYSAVALGFLGTVVAARIFDTATLGLFALVVSSTNLLQLLLDLTIEEALIKWGFRYVAREDWGRLHRLFGQIFWLKALGAILGGLGLLGLAAGATTVFGHAELRLPLAIAAALPLLQAPEGMAAVALMLRGRYDLRGGFLAVSMLFRLAAIALGAPHGLAAVVVGLAAAQAAASAAIAAAGFAAFRRYPRAAPVPLGPDRREIVRFVLQSSAATTIVSLRATLVPVLLGIVSTAIQVGFFRVAQSPQQGFDAMSAPIRMVLLTEQTRDWEHGRFGRVFAGVRRYTLLAALGCLLLLPPLLVFMPQLVRLLFEAKNLGAVHAARIVVVAGAVMFVVGWSKSFAVTVGRPQWRVWTHLVESAVLLPLAILLGLRFGAAGAAAAVLAGSVAFALAWAVLYARIRRATPDEAIVEPERRPLPVEARS